MTDVNIIKFERMILDEVCTWILISYNKLIMASKKETEIGVFKSITASYGRSCANAVAADAQPAKCPQFVQPVPAQQILPPTGRGNLFSCISLIYTSHRNRPGIARFQLKKFA